MPATPVGPLKYDDLERIVSPARMARYVKSCGGDTEKAMELYRLNIKVSQELFTVISCFEIALRNATDKHCSTHLGNEWLLESVLPRGCFDNDKCRMSYDSIKQALRNLGRRYTHNKLVAELGFGFWRYMYAPHQFAATGKILLRAFPKKPKSSPGKDYNNKYILNHLAQINGLRNRIAHHEPICFKQMHNQVSTGSVRHTYAIICELLLWMDIDHNALLYGLDNMISTADRLDRL